MLPGRDHKGRSLPSPSPPSKPDLPPPLPHGVDAKNTCSGCDEAATHGCVQCEDVYCEGCMAYVHRLKKNQAHERLLIADYLQRKPSPAPTCPTHTRELEFFCVRCDVLICAYCQVYGAEHYAHEARSFNDAHAAVQQEMQLVGGRARRLDARRGRRSEGGGPRRREGRASVGAAARTWSSAI